MRYPRLLLLCGLLLFGAEAYAEQGCPDGFTPNAAPTGTPGANQCVPIPGYGGPSSGPQVPQERWINRYGAIAYDPDTGKVGVANDMTSKRKAASTAIGQCRSKGGQACKVNIDYFNQCAAFVYGGLGEVVDYASSTGGSQGEAENRALTRCKTAAGVECKIFYSACSYPQRIQ